MNIVRAVLLCLMLLGVAGSIIIATEFDTVGLFIAGFFAIIALLLSYVEMMRKDEP